MLPIIGWIILAAILTLLALIGLVAAWLHFEEENPQEENKTLRFNFAPRREMTTPIIPQVADEPQRAKKKRRWPWVLGSLVAVLILVTMCSRGGDDPSTTADPSATESGKPASSSSKTTKPAPTAVQAMPGIGDKVKDGDVQFVVKSFKCGIKEISNDFDTNKPSGQYCLATLTITNKGNEPLTISDGNQTLFLTNGKKYVPDDELWLVLESNLFEEINPDNSVAGKIAWDIPKTGKPDFLLLKAGDFGFSEGVKVSVKTGA